MVYLVHERNLDKGLRGGVGKGKSVDTIRAKRDACEFMNGGLKNRAC